MRGGGVLVAINNTIKSTRLNSPDELEVIAVSLDLQQAVTVCTVYVPPNAPLELLTLCDFLRRLNQNSRTMVVIGDFNLLDINWSTISGCSPASSLFCDCVFDCNLCQLVANPTHTK